VAIVGGTCFGGEAAVNLTLGRRRRSTRILVVEDEPKAADYLREGLGESGYLVEVAHNGLDGQFLAQENDFDLVILDVMLPGLDGWQLLRSIRRKSAVPVLFLTARDSVDDRVKGLELGADDYLVKPFSYAELLARVRTLLRRGPPREVELFRLADLQLEVLSRRVTRGGDRITLTNQEFALLHLLLTREGEVLYRCDSSRAEPGDSGGLGLAIVRSIMLLHGGEVSVQSDTDITRFVLSFPMPT